MVFIDLIAANVLKQQANLHFRSEKFLNLELLVVTISVEFSRLGVV